MFVINNLFPLSAILLAVVLCVLNYLDNKKCRKAVERIIKRDKRNTETFCFMASEEYFKATLRVDAMLNEMGLCGEDDKEEV